MKNTKVDWLDSVVEDDETRLRLEDGSRVAVVGGGPAGSFFSYFLLDLAERMGLELAVDLYEPRDYVRPGPASCNHCGGIVSESLVQILAAEGIALPETVVQRGIDSYVLHVDLGSVRIETPLHEKRIAAVYRGAGPRGVENSKWGSFDGYLQCLAIERGANLVPERVEDISLVDGSPVLKSRTHPSEAYDLLVGAVGVNSSGLKLFEGLGMGFKRPETARTYICELPLGEDVVRQCVGSSMHIFLLDMPNVEFAALIPKGDHLTVCMLGKGIDKAVVEAFMTSPEVRRCLPPDWSLPEVYCHCSPMIGMGPAARPFCDRLVMIGDCGVTRLYKDGIGAAYRTAKAAATTAVFEGVGERDFKAHYWPTYRSIAVDNAIGKLVFGFTHQIQKRGLGRRAVLRMATNEWRRESRNPRMSTVLWDTFTGSATYRDIFYRTLHPAFVVGLFWNVLLAGLKGLPTLWRRIKDHEQQPNPSLGDG